MTTDQPSIDEYLVFQKGQGKVQIRRAMLAWNEETKAFAVIRHPCDPRLFRLLGLRSDAGAKWRSWAVAADGTNRSTASILALLNAEVLAVLLAGEADPKMVRQALAFIPEWNAKFGDSAPWPYSEHA